MSQVEQRILGTGSSWCKGPGAGSQQGGRGEEEEEEESQIAEGFRAMVKMWNSPPVRQEAMVGI